MSYYERLGFRAVEKYRQTDYPEMYIDMQPIVERMHIVSFSTNLSTNSPTNLPLLFSEASVILTNGDVTL